MAEYMDIARIDDWDNLSIIDDNGNAINVYDVGELPRADVVEREKIDKAIEEIHSYARFHRDKIHDDVEQGKYLAYEKCLEILKRNIGE